VTSRRATAPPVSRRTALAGVGGAAGLAFAAACSDTTDSASDGGENAGEDPGEDAGGGAGTELTALSDVPVGGAVAVEGADGKPLLVTRPSEDEVIALSAVCTHQGCAVAPDGERLRCPCHGSTYDLTGKNIDGPAPSPLTPVTVEVVDGTVVTSG